MPLAIYTSAAWTANGGITPAANATVEVRRHNDDGSVSLASLFSDRSGDTAEDNPFNADPQGRFAFFAAGGAYRVTVTDSEGNTDTLEYQSVGTAGELDTEDVIALANEGVFESTSDGITATSDGEYFWVPDDDEVVLYLNDDGSAVEQLRIPSTALARNIRDATQSAGNLFADTAAGLAATDDGEYFSVVGSDAFELYRNDAGSAVLEFTYGGPQGDAPTDIPTNSTRDRQVTVNAETKPTLTEDDLSANSIEVVDTLTEDRTITVPDRARVLPTFINNTTGDFTVTISTTTGSGTEIEQGVVSSLYSDGTDVVAAGGVGIEPNQTPTNTQRLRQITIDGDSDHTLTDAEATADIIRLTGTLTAPRELEVSDVERQYTIVNDRTGDDTTVKTSAGTGVVVPRGETSVVRSDGTNVVPRANAFGGKIIGEVFHLPVRKSASVSFPALRLTGEDQTITDTAWPLLVPELRDALAYYRDGATETDTFDGTVSGSVLTLDDSAAENELVEALAEDFLFSGEHKTVTFDSEDWEITDVDPVTREITVSGSPTDGAKTVEVHPYRVAGESGQAKIGKADGIVLAGVGASGRMAGLATRDQMQQITGLVFSQWGDSPNPEGAFSSSVRPSTNNNTQASSESNGAIDYYFDSADSPNARTGTTTRDRSLGVELYIYGGQFNE